MTLTLKSMTLTGLFAAFAFVVPGGTAMAQQIEATTQLAALARDARTPSEHASVAKAYRLQAESFEARADDYEALVATRSRNQPGIALKWPAMAPPDVVSAKAQAREARSAARQSRELAADHLRMSVEANAD